MKLRTLVQLQPPPQLTNNTMSKQELLSVLSNININSETALEAVSLYVDYLHFEAALDAGACFVLFGGVILIAFTLIKMLSQD